MNLSLEAAVFNFEYDGEDFTITVHSSTLTGCFWRPPSPQYVFLFVHGLSDFVTVNHDISDIIVASGGVFMGCDHIGHGRSPGPRISCTIDEIVEETELVIQKARELFPTLPIFLYGYSMGALSVLHLIFQKRDFATSSLRAAIVQSPWISMYAGKLSFIESVAVWIGAKVTPLLKFPAGTDKWPADLRSDYIESLIHCPHYFTHITPRLLDSALRTMTTVRQKYREWPKELPILFMQGGSDVLVDPETNRAWFEAVREATGEKVVDIKLYEGGNHNLLKGRVTRPLGLQDILDFINRLK
jgi:acylglycerol lipase